MDGPKCGHVALVQRKVPNEDVQLDVCPRCKGVWLEANELNEILSTAIKSLRPPSDAKESDWNCPACERPLKKFNYPQTYVEIDMCPSCLGIWLDPREFKEIKVVRKHFRKKGELQMEMPVGGIKGALLEWIDATLAELTSFD